MTSKRRRVISTPGEQRDSLMRSSVGFATSVVVHVVLVLTLVRLLLVPNGWLSQLSEKSPPIEHIGVITLPRSDKPQPLPPKSGGDNRPDHANPTPVPPPIVAPTSVPTIIAPPSKESVTPRVESGAGPLIGGGGPTRGISPYYSDPRLWVLPGPVVSAPLTPRQRMDSVIATNFGALQDSIDAIPKERAAGDWTVKKGGKTYGIDPRYIHLGNISIPTALLALLPINLTSNPTTYQKSQQLGLVRREIQEQAARMGRDDDFKAAVKALRERKDKERNDKKAADAPAIVPPARF